MAGQSTFPIPTSGSVYSSQPPVNTSGVLLDGSLVSSGSVSTSITGTGSTAILTANGAETLFNIAGTQYVVHAGTTVETSVINGSKSVSVIQAPVNFTASTLPSTNYWSAVAYGAGKFVATAGSYNQTPTTAGAYSTDGVTWNSMTMSQAGDFSSLSYGLVGGTGYFFAVAYQSGGTNGPAAYSTDGITWTNTGLPTSGSGLYYQGSIGNGYFFAAPWNTQYFFYSSNHGQSWSGYQSLPNATVWTAICYGNNTYVTLSRGGTTGYGAYSYNLTTWTAVNIPFNQNWNSIVYANGKFVAVGTGVASTDVSSLYSTDGITWTASALPTANTSANAVTFGNGYFLATSTSGIYSGSPYYYSTDGITWTANAMPSPQDWSAVAYGNGKFVAVSQTNGTSAAYSSAIPSTFGIYNGPAAH